MHYIYTDLIYRARIRNRMAGWAVTCAGGGRGRGKSDLFKYVPSLSVRVCAKLLGYEKNGD